MDETGLIGVFHLKRMWSRYMADRAGTGSTNGAEQEWAEDNTVLSGLGLGLHETIQYVYSTAPSFEEFERWVLAQNGGSIAQLRVETINAALRREARPAQYATGFDALTAEDLAFWDEHGYVVVHGAVSEDNCKAAVAAICGFLGMDLSDRETWYKGPQGHSIWVPLLRHPAIQANRESPRVRRAFEQIWGRTDLWMTTDQCGMNPPERPGWQFPGPHLHWDVSLELPIPFGVQGILYLARTAADQGAFTCVPGFHRKIDDWIRSLPPDADPRQQDLTALGPKPIAGEAGDLIIWHYALPHGSSPNRATMPRFVQYMTMRPSDFEQQSKWK